MKTYEDYLKEYIELVIKLADYDKTSNIVNNENYDNKVSLKISKKINSKIQGLKKKNPFFEKLYKELYNVNDLASLNKE